MQKLEVLDELIQKLTCNRIKGEIIQFSDYKWHVLRYKHKKYDHSHLWCFVSVQVTSSDKYEALFCKDSAIYAASALGGNTADTLVSYLVLCISVI